MAIEFNTLVCYIKNMSTVASLLPQDEQAIITHYCVCFRCQFEKRQAKKNLKTLLTFTEKILKVCSSLENYTTYYIALLNFFFLSLLLLLYLQSISLPVFVFKLFYYTLVKH